MKVIVSVAVLVCLVGIVLGGIPYSWVLYKQCDGRWANEKIGKSSETICQVGCAMSSVSMALATYGEQIPRVGTVTPATLNSWLTTHAGYINGDDLIWDAIHSIGKLRMISYTPDLTRAQMVSYIEKRMPVIVNVRQGTHWVLVTGYSESNPNLYYVNDPGFEQNTYTREEMSRFVAYSNNTVEFPINESFRGISDRAHTLKEATFAGSQ